VLFACLLGAGAAAWRNPSTPKTAAARLPAGDALALTDGTGAPTGPCHSPDGHPLARKADGGYHWFWSSGPGVAALADEPWELPIRVEADVAVKFGGYPRALGGVYVGRHSWPGLEITHQSLIVFGVAPRFEPKQGVRHQLGCISELYWWERDQYGSRNTAEEKRRPWSADDAVDAPRFARIAIDVTADEVRGVIDGTPLKPVTSRALAAQLARDVASRPHFPRYEFRQSPIGRGIGVFCESGECAVVNLTVSKPNP
jgi:hypothetical protein